MLNRTQQRILNRPSTVETALQRFGRHSLLVGPIGHWHRDAIQSQQSVRAFISSLNIWSDPSSIQRPLISKTLGAMATRIVAVIVFAVKRMFRRWTQADICKENGKVVKPSFANSNTSIGITSGVKRGDATSFHIAPRKILRSMSQSVPFMSLAGALSRPTSARLRCSIEQRILSNGQVCPTGATAIPHPSFLTFALLWLGFADYRQSAKLLIGEIVDFSLHGIILPQSGRVSN